MKKYIVIVIALLASTYTRADYTPTTQDKSQISSLQQGLDTMIGNNNKDLRHYLDQVDTLRARFATSTKIGYMLQQLYQHLRYKLDIQKDAAKI